MSHKKSTLVSNVGILLIVTLVAVALLAIVNQITRDPIAQAEAEARAEIYRNVYSDAADIEDVSNLDEMLSDYLAYAQYPTNTINAVLIAKDSSGTNIGYVIDVTSSNGYGGDIQIALGITNEGTITAFSVVSQSETAGLGSKSTEPEFADQFAGKKAETIEYTKTGASADNEIDAISGATITTNAVTEAVNEAISFYNNMLKGE